ncbi:MAG: hypothetical protein ACI9Y1_003344 [Lentisphaeria bacterium]|jgi:hypothetical protein
MTFLHSYDKAKMRLQVLSVGNECTPVIVVDEVARDVGAVYKDIVSHSKFSVEKNTYYPGIRAKIFPDYGMELFGLAAECINQCYQIPSVLKPIHTSAFYSIVARSANELQVRQRIPHYDNNSEYSFAAMHYVSEGKFGGTGFFRHKPSGYESISVARLKEYHLQTDNIEVELNKYPAEYITGSTGIYTLTEKVNYLANRLIIFPAMILHSGLINEANDVYCGKGVPRLTANLSISYICP